MKQEKTEKKKTDNMEMKDKIENSICNDRNCHIHGKLKLRGRMFEGIVIKKFRKRIAIEFERMIYIRKYERYMKGKTKIHAHISDCLSGKIHVGDLVRVMECRPLSKIIHFAVVEKIKDKMQTHSKSPSETRSEK